MTHLLVVLLLFPDLLAQVSRRQTVQHRLDALAAETAGLEADLAAIRNRAAALAQSVTDDDAAVGRLFS